MAGSDRTRSNAFNLKEGRFRVGIWKKFFSVRVMRRCNRFPQEVVDDSSLEVFKARLDGALSNLVYWKVSLPMAGELGLDDAFRYLPIQTILSFYNSRGRGGHLEGAWQA